MDKSALELWKDRADLAALIFAFVVGVGVVGEFIAHFAYRYFSRKLEPIIATEEKELREHVAQANIRAADATEHAAEANKQAAEANRVAEQERLARVKLEEKLAFRHLTLEQKRSLIAKLAPCAGHSVQVFAQSRDFEA